MGESEQPLVVGRIDFHVETVDASTVVLTNPTAAWAPFVLLIVPNFVVGAVAFPWREFLDRVKTPDGLAQAAMAIAHQIQQRFLDPK